MRSRKDLCENLINALKLLANQQKDGDSPIQNIIMVLEENCRGRVTNGLRSIIIGQLQCSGGGSLAWRSAAFEVKMSEDSSEVLREGADDLTLGAAEFDALKACINVDHIDKKCGARPWWMQIGTLSAKQLVKELKEVSGKSCIIITET